MSKFVDFTKAHNLHTCNEQLKIAVKKRMMASKIKYLWVNVTRCVCPLETTRKCRGKLKKTRNRE